MRWMEIKVAESTGVRVNWCRKQLKFDWSKVWVIIVFVWVIIAFANIIQWAYGVEVDCGFTGWNTTSANGQCTWIKLPHKQLVLGNQEALYDYKILNGTWNIVNSTDGTSGTISFGNSLRFVQHYNGIHHGMYWMSWFEFPKKLHLGYDTHSWHCCFAVKLQLTFKTVTPNHIEFTDNHGGTIHLMRGDTALKNNSSQLEHQTHTDDNQRGPGLLVNTKR
jgi:hypothetical protein